MVFHRAHPGLWHSSCRADFHPCRALRTGKYCFCVLLHKSEEIYRKLFQNPYIRIFAGGCIVVILTMLVGNQNYNGTGIGIIQMCIDGTVRPEAFLLKMIFTALTLGAGYKGGEIVPSFSPARPLAACLER